jgi:acetyl-CoA carboxylase biotin carboxyl carrier protein
MTPEEIERLAACCAAAGIGRIELSEPGFSLRLAIVAQPVAEAPRAAAVAPAKTEPPQKAVRSPCIGVFRLVHPATGRLVAEPGKAVREGETVGVLQAGPLLRAVTAPMDGVLGEALAEDGTVVGYGAPLYLLS